MLAKIVKTVLKFLFRVQVIGDAKEFNQDKCLITPNHVSFLDGVLIALFACQTCICCLFNICHTENGEAP